jgi:hypothetical protein
MRGVVFCCLLGFASPLVAQEAPLDETYAIANVEEGAPSLEETLPPTEHKVPDVALGLSLGLTSLSFIVGAELSGIGANADIPALQVAGFGVITSGIVLLPSSGHLYAKDSKQLWRGIGVRTGAALVGSSMLLVSSRSDSSAVDSVSLGIAGVMGAIALLSGIHDVADSEDAVRRYNKANP